jgi:hypothetical protein
LSDSSLRFFGTAFDEDNTLALHKGEGEHAEKAHKLGKY